MINEIRLLPDKKMYSLSKTTILYIVSTIIAIIMLVPFLWLFISSLKATDIFTYPPKWIPHPFTLKNYVDAWAAAPFGRYSLNSIVVTAGTVILHLFIGSLAGYAFARMNFWGRDFIFIILLSTMMIPNEVIMAPTFLLIQKLGLLDNYGGLIIPFCISGFTILIIREFFKTIPMALSDAARVDGCTEFKIYWSIIMPISKPVITSVVIFNGVWAWCAFTWPLIIVNNPDMRTLPLGLAMFQSFFDMSWGLVASGVVLSILPPLLLFLFMQDAFVEGLTAGAIKG